MSNLSIVTYNCRGLNETVKRQKLFAWFECEKFDVILLQETFCTKQFEKIFKSGWKGFSLLATSDSSHSRGVAILFRSNFDIEITSKYTSEDGRIAIVNANFRNNFLSFVSVYAPNIESERVIFFENLQHKILKNVINPDNIIVGGDFNCGLILSDRLPVSKRIDKSVQYFVYLLKTCNLTDSWTKINSGKPGYTYFDKKSNSYSRLDYILVSQNSTLHTKNIKITQPIKNPGVVDHSAVKLMLKMSNFC